MSCVAKAMSGVICRTDERVCKTCRDSAPPVSPEFVKRNAAAMKLAVRAAKISGLAPTGST